MCDPTWSGLFLTRHSDSLDIWILRATKQSTCEIRNSKEACFHISYILLSPPDCQHSDPTGPDCMSSHVPSDEVHSSLQWNAETVHLHTHDRQLVSHIVVCQTAQVCAAPPSHFCLSFDSVRLVNEFNNMPVPSKTKQQGESSKSVPNGICSCFLSETLYVVCCCCC